MDDKILQRFIEQHNVIFVVAMLSVQLQTISDSVSFIELSDIISDMHLSSVPEWVYPIIEN